MTIESELEALIRKREKLKSNLASVREDIDRLERLCRQRQQRERVQSLRETDVYLNLSDIADPCQIIEVRRTRADVRDSNGKVWDVPISRVQDKPHDAVTRAVNQRLQKMFG